MTSTDGALHLTAVTLEPRGPAGAIVLTDAQVASFGGGKTPPVRVTAKGVTVAARVGRMGGENLIGLSKGLRAQLGLELGDVFDVVIAADTAPRTVEVPPALAAALARHPAEQTAFDGLAPSHRKEFARWIAEAKREATTTARVEQTLQMLRTGRTR